MLKNKIPDTVKNTGNCKIREFENSRTQIFDIIKFRNYKIAELENSRNNQNPEYQHLKKLFKKNINKIIFLIIIILDLKYKTIIR